MGRRRLFVSDDPDVSASRTGPLGPSRRLVIAAALRRARDDDEAVTEVIGYVLSFALSAIFLLLALNVFWAARSNTESVTTGVELKTIADRVAAHVVEMGTISQEFPSARMSTTLVIPQTLNGKLYTVSLTDDAVTATLDTEELSASSTIFNIKTLPDVSPGGSAGSSNERIIVSYYPDDPTDVTTRYIQLSGE